LCRNL